MAPESVTSLPIAGYDASEPTLRRAADPPSTEDEAFQAASLAEVSRTFALTIPQLPEGLDRAVANAYLLCRIADTIEDDPGIPHEQKTASLRAFLAELEAGGDGASLARSLEPMLSDATLDSEHRLIREMPRVLRITRSLPEGQRRAIIRCVAIMGQGMSLFSRMGAGSALETLEDLQRYCYHVAGVVGEMLTDLFCTHSSAVARHRAKLKTLAVSFGQGLQMTNVLKDIWDDFERGTCWLPRRLFAESGCDLDSLVRCRRTPEFSRALLHLVAVAHGNLRDALAYVQTIPRRESGIRRFLMWAVGLAALTLSRIADNPAFVSGNEVKVSRKTVRTVIALTNLSIRSNTALDLLFRRWSRSLPAPVFTTEFVARLSPDGWCSSPDCP